MPTLSIQHADIEQQRRFGELTPAYVFKVPQGTLERSHIPFLWRWHRDSIDQSEVDLLLVERVPVVLKRHLPRCSQKYTIMVDVDRARAAGSNPLELPRALLSELGVSDKHVTWVNELLTEDGNASEKERVSVPG